MTKPAKRVARMPPISIGMTSCLAWAWQEADLLCLQLSDLSLGVTATFHVPLRLRPDRSLPLPKIDPESWRQPLLDHPVAGPCSRFHRILARHGSVARGGSPAPTRSTGHGPSARTRRCKQTGMQQSSDEGGGGRPAGWERSARAHDEANPKTHQATKSEKSVRLGLGILWKRYSHPLCPKGKDGPPSRI
jgi:hypothetical protein